MAVLADTDVKPVVKDDFSIERRISDFTGLTKFSLSQFSVMIFSVTCIPMKFLIFHWLILIPFVPKCDP